MLLWIIAIFRVIYVLNIIIHVSRSTGTLSVVVIVLVKLECMMASFAGGAQTTGLSNDPLLSTCAMYACIPCTWMHSIESHV